MDNTKVSKFLSLILRHAPEKGGITLDENGWTDVKTLLSQLAKHNHKITMIELEDVVETNEKKRFAFNDKKTKIRANQGHSVDIDLKLVAVEPPALLFHGTVNKFLSAIKKDGLLKMSRQHVHLSKDRDTAVNVASRRGNPIILLVETLKMHEDGFKFFLSDNGVWLTDNVPSKYIKID